MIGEGGCGACDGKYLHEPSILGEIRPLRFVTVSLASRGVFWMEVSGETCSIFDGDDASMQSVFVDTTFMCQYWAFCLV